MFWRRVEAEITEGERCRWMLRRFFRPAEPGIVTSTGPDGTGSRPRHPAGLVAQCSVSYGVDAAVEVAGADPVVNTVPV
jgi:hypothetical protein